MPLKLKPHTAAIKSVGDNSGSAVDGFTRTGTSTVLGQLSRLTPSAAFERWGIEVRQPGEWRQNLGAAVLKPGDHLIIGSETWAILTTAQKMDSDAITSHEVFLVQKI